MDKDEEKCGGEQNGSCPTHGWVSEYELFGERCLPVVIENMMVCTQQRWDQLRKV